MHTVSSGDTVGAWCAHFNALGTAFLRTKSKTCGAFYALVGPGARALETARVALAAHTIVLIQTFTAVGNANAVFAASATGLALEMKTIAALCASRGPVTLRTHIVASRASRVQTATALARKIKARATSIAALLAFKPKTWAAAAKAEEVLTCRAIALTISTAAVRSTKTRGHLTFPDSAARASSTEGATGCF